MLCSQLSALAGESQIHVASEQTNERDEHRQPGGLRSTVALSRLDQRLVHEGGDGGEESGPRHELVSKEHSSHGQRGGDEGLSVVLLVDNMHVGHTKIGSSFVRHLFCLFCVC